MKSKISLIILVVVLISWLGGCVNVERVKEVKVGDTLHYTYTGVTTYTIVVVKNDTLNKVLKVKSQNIFDSELWTDGYMYYDEIAKYCTRWK